jgi:hypothetical protein
MKPGVCGVTLVCAGLLAGLLCAGSAEAQQANSAAGTKPTAPAAYDVRREGVLQGTVVSFTSNSSTGSSGAHAILQTASGEVDVALGSAQLLASKNFSLNAGDAVKITGETVALGNGTQFVARVVQKGDQIIAVRSVRGFPIRPLNKPAGGAL